MKYVLLLSFLFQIGIAQEENSIPVEDVFEVAAVDYPPSFPGGVDNFYTFFENNFKKPDVPQLLGKLFVSFIVEIDGTLSNIKTIKDVGFGSGLEAERVMQLSPKWNVGRKNGKRVRVMYTIPIPIQTK
jgi:protein TonB